MCELVTEKSAFEYGLVNHALSSAMRTLIKDYMVLVAQLEQQLRVVCPVHPYKAFKQLRTSGTIVSSCCFG